MPEPQIIPYRPLPGVMLGLPSRQSGVYCFGCGRYRYADHPADQWPDLYRCTCGQLIHTRPQTDAPQAPHASAPGLPPAAPGPGAGASIDIGEIIPLLPPAVDRYRLVVPGVPIAKKRPRFVALGSGQGRTYSCQETEEGKYRWELKVQWAGRSLLTGPLALGCVFVLPIPQSTSKARLKLMAEGAICHTKKPDADNLLKFVKDACNGLIWRDDSQVVAYVEPTRKVYGLHPRTEITILKLKEIDR